jgi:hypothetical protein
VLFFFAFAMEKGLQMDGKNAARRRWWVWVGAAVVGVPLAVFLALLAAVLIRAGVATAPQCAIALLNEARTAGVVDAAHAQRVDRLAAALRFRTVSFDVGNQTVDQFPLLLQHLRDSESTSNAANRLFPHIFFALNVSDSAQILHAVNLNNLSSYSD